jgi:hypothetical protein
MGEEHESDEGEDVEVVVGRSLPVSPPHPLQQGGGHGCATQKAILSGWWMLCCSPRLGSDEKKNVGVMMMMMCVLLSTPARSYDRAVRVLFHDDGSPR